MPPPDRAAIELTAHQIAPYVRRTPTMDVEPGTLADVAVVAKLEQLQVTGTFKARGAFTTLLATEADEVVIASGGNAGAAFAHAGQRLGRRVAVFVPSTSPSEKVDRLRAYGADVHVVDGYYPQALAASREHAVATGAVECHAYDRDEMLLGAGTIASEWQAQRPVDTLLVAVGGGGLIGGIAAWCRDHTRVVAVETHGTATLHASLAAGEPVEVSPAGVAASSLGAARIGTGCWEARGWIDDAVLVDDEAVVAAQQSLWSHLRVVAEPGGAAALAALQAGAYTPQVGERVGVLVCGANTAPGNVG